MKIARILAPFALGLLACSSSTTVTDPNGGTGTPQDRGVDGTGDTTAAQQATDKGLDGTPYPSDNLGTTVGTKIQNYKFLGYPDGDPSKGLQPMSLANFFDPTGKTYKLIHIQASGTWCTYCKQETRTVTPLAQKLQDRKVVWVISLAEGNALGTPATKDDLDKWIALFKAPFPHLLDSGNKNFGPFYDAAALPWNANIDARTMKILSTGVGAATTESAILSDVDKYLAQLN